VTPCSQILFVGGKPGGAGRAHSGHNGVGAYRRKRRERWPQVANAGRWSAASGRARLARAMDGTTRKGPGARAKIAGFRVGWQGWHTVREEEELRVPNSSQLTAQASRKLGALLPLDVQHTTSGGARWGFEAERVKLAWSTGIRKHTSAQRRQGSGAGTWLVGGFEFGYLLQCGGGGAGREACNVPLGWTTGSSSLLAGVLLRLGRIAGQDFEGSSSSRSQLRHMTV
jgi:hypothetical protein